MRSILGVPEAMLESVATFCSAADIPLEVVSTGDCTVRVVEAEERLPSTLSCLYIDGWIACGRAHVIAARLQIQTRQIGKLLDLFNIKIRHCQLGCFH